MFDKDIQEYVGPDGELTEEAAVKLYGRRYVYQKYFRRLTGAILGLFRTLMLLSLVVGGVVGGAILASMCCAVLLVGLTMPKLATQVADSPTPTVIVQPTPSHSPQFSRCLSPSQERIIFNAQSQVGWFLYVINPDNPPTICQMTDYSQVGNPSRSPDGSKIAYENLDSGTISILYLSSYNTQQFRQPDTYSNLSAPAWSPDGSQLVIQAGKDHECSNLLTFSLDGTHREITSGEACDITPDWSPNGIQIIFARATTSGDDLEVYSYNLITHQLRQLTDNTLHDYGPVWSPDGTQIAFSSEDGIYIMDANGANMQRVIEFGQWPAWSPDGSRLAFVSNRENPNGNATAPFIANADGTNIRRLTDYINAMHPGWR